MAIVVNDREKKKKHGESVSKRKCGFYKYCQMSCRGVQVMLAGGS